MGHKIKPNSFRLGILRGWHSRWIGNRIETNRFLEEDILIRKIINKKLSQAGIVDINIERTVNAYRVFIKAARPGLIIGRGGKGVEELNKEVIKALIKLRKKNNISNPIPNINLSVLELSRGEISAQVVAKNIASDLERRLKFRRTVKKYLDETMAMRGIKGVKIKVGGRLDGAEIARVEWLTAGNLPLATLRADVDYGVATAFTTYGTIGIKVWVYKGEIFQ